MSAPLVSVVVFTYNQEKLLPQTLESIVAQDFPVENYEVVVGEDCSSDGTADVLKKYAAQYPQIHPLYNPQNLGILKNYINILAHCRGKYIMVCAGDDYWLPEKMRFQFDFMEKNPDIAMIYGDFYCLKDGELSRGDSAHYKPVETFEELLFHNPICAPTTCWRKEFWEGFVKDIDPVACGFTVEDWPMWLYLAAKGKIKHIARDFCVYRVAGGSASNPRPDENDLAHMEGFLLNHDDSIYRFTRLFGQKFAPEKMPWIEKEIARRLFELFFRSLMHYGYMPTMAQKIFEFARLYPDFLTPRKKCALFLLQNKTLWNTARRVVAFLRK